MSIVYSDSFTLSNNDLNSDQTMSESPTIILPICTEQLISYSSSLFNFKDCLIVKHESLIEFNVLNSEP